MTATAPGRPGAKAGRMARAGPEGFRHEREAAEVRLRRGRVRPGGGPGRSAALVLQLKPVDGLLADGGATRLDFAQFDPSLGTLTGVRVELDLLSTGDSTTLGNHANQPKAFAYTLAQEASLAAPGLDLDPAESRPSGRGARSKTTSSRASKSTTA